MNKLSTTTAVHNTKHTIAPAPLSTGNFNGGKIPPVTTPDCIPLSGEAASQLYAIASKIAYTAVRRAYIGGNNSDGLQTMTGGEQRLREILIWFKESDYERKVKRLEAAELRAASARIVAMESAKKRAGIKDAIARADAKREWEASAAKQALDAAQSERRAALRNLAALSGADVGAADLIQEAVAALLDAGYNPADMEVWQVNGAYNPAIKAAYAAVHAAIYAECSATSTRVRVTRDVDGKILAASEYRYIRYPHMYTEDTETGDLIDTTDELEHVLTGLYTQGLKGAIATALKPRPRKVLSYLVRGYSTSEIAKKLGISDRMVREHHAVIRETAARVIAEYGDISPDYTALVTAAAPIVVDAPSAPAAPSIHATIAFPDGRVFTCAPSK